MWRSEGGRWGAGEEREGIVGRGAVNVCVVVVGGDSLCWQPPTCWSCPCLLLPLPTLFPLPALVLSRQMQ